MPGRRTKKTVSGTTTNYFYSGPQVISELQGSTWTDFVFFGDIRIAQQSGSYLSAAKFLHRDHLGSTRVCTDGSGNSLGTCDYEPFGEFQPGSSCSDLPTTYRYAAMEYDSETGFYHTQFRYYDPNQGRWMSVDSLPGTAKNPQSEVRYAYVLNDPINKVDPLGLAPCHTMWVDAILQTYMRYKYDGFWTPWQLVDTQEGQVQVMSCDGGPERFGGDRGGGGGGNSKIDSARKTADSILNGKNPCADWFDSSFFIAPGSTAADVLDAINPQEKPNLIPAEYFGRFQAGHVVMPEVASTSRDPTWGQAMGVMSTIDIYSGGAFFEQSIATPYGKTIPLSAGPYAGGTPGAQVLILMHELAHALGLFGHDTGGLDSAANDLLLLGHCAPQIAAAVSASPNN